MSNILLLIELLEDDYLGGHGTRGYGRVKFENMSLEEKVYTDESRKEIESVRDAISEFENELEKR